MYKGENINLGFSSGYEYELTEAVAAAGRRVIVMTYDITNVTRRVCSVCPEIQVIGIERDENGCMDFDVSIERLLRVLDNPYYSFDGVVIENIDFEFEAQWRGLNPEGTSQVNIRDGAESWLDPIIDGFVGSIEADRERALERIHGGDFELHH